MNTHPASVDITIGFSTRNFGHCLIPGERTQIADGIYMIKNDYIQGTFLTQNPTNKEPLELFFPGATPDDIKNAITAAGLPLQEVRNHANTYFTGYFSRA